MLFAFNLLPALKLKEPSCYCCTFKIWFWEHTKETQREVTNGCPLIFLSPLSRAIGISCDSRPFQVDFYFILGDWAQRTAHKKVLSVLLQQAFIVTICGSFHVKVNWWWYHHLSTRRRGHTQKQRKKGLSSKKHHITSWNYVSLNSP